MASNAWADTIKQLEAEEQHLKDAVEIAAILNEEGGDPAHIYKQRFANRDPITRHHTLPGSAMPRGATDFVAGVSLPLDRIADIMIHMPYGDMMELAKGIVDKAEDNQSREMASRLWYWARNRV